jgi:hypothetical protein
MSECPFLRVFGITERAGMVRIVFWGGEPSGTNDYRLFDVSISLVVSITNPVAANGLTDAVLVSRAMDPRAGPVATVAGRLTHTNRLLFERVPIHPPGKVGTWQLVIDHVRANASQFNAPTEDEIRAGRSDLLAFVSVTPSELNSGLQAPLIRGELCTTGRLIAPLYGRLISLRSFRNLEDRNEHLAVDHLAHNARTSFLVELQETFLGAFGTLHDEGAGATSGMRFLVKFEGIPDSTAVFVTTRDLVDEGSEPSVILIKGHDANGAGGYRVPIAAPPGTGRTAEGVPIDRIRELPGGTAFAVWEWISPMDGSTERRRVQLGIALAVAPGEIPQGGLKVRCGLAPSSTVTVANRTAPVPRFVPILVPITGYFSFPS